LIPATIGIALLLHWIRQKNSRGLLVLILTVCVLEQVNLGGKVLLKRVVQEEVESIAEQVDPEAGCFLLVPQVRRRDLAQLAWWVALASRKPTLNASYLHGHLYPPQARENALEKFLGRFEEDLGGKVQLIELGR
jgi:hypothetical protein